MLKNYFTVTLRQLWNHKLFSAFNIFGLATSMSVCLLLIMLLADQYSFDTFHEQKNDLFRVISAKAEKNIPLERPDFATTALSLAEPLTNDYSWVEKATRIVQVDSDFKVDEQSSGQGGAGYAVDPSFLEMFSFGWTAGDRQTALRQPGSLVLTQTTAERLFAGANPVGEVIELIELGEYTVTGIIPDPPVRSHIQFDFLISFASVLALSEEERAQISIYSFDDIWRGLVYVQLAEEADQGQLDRALTELAAAYSLRDPDHHFLFEAQHLTDVLPSRGLSNEIGIATPRMVLIFLMALGLIIILSACFNYTGLSIARSLQRSKEIGIRKVIGAGRKDIIVQFITEGIVLALLSLGIALGLLEFLVPAFYGLDPFVSEIFTLEKSFPIFLTFLGFGILVGLLASVLPALNIAGYQPMLAIRRFTDVKLLSRIGLRKGLITLQFALSLIFVLTVIIVLKQQERVLHADLGSRTENLLNVRMQEVNYDVFAQQVRQLQGVQDVSASRLVMLTGENFYNMVTFGDDRDSMRLFRNVVSANYLDNLDIQLVAGENFPRGSHEHTDPFVILNETAVRRMGYQDPAEALGKTITQDTLVLTIIGVTEDFHHDNIWFAPIQPFGIRQGTDFARNASITLHGNDLSETLAAVQSIWNNLAPDQPMHSFFMDEEIYYLSKFFRMGSRIIGFVGLLTIIIACMGLLGMVLYTVEGRIKEIGIRKILGATEGNIVWEISRGFFLLLGIAIVLATPFTVIIANLWLQNFLIRIAIGPEIILSGIGITLFVGLLTVISQTLAAARNNPVEALRAE